MDSRLQKVFQPAQPIPADILNAILEALRNSGKTIEALRELPGYSEVATQALMNVTGDMQWVTVQTCTTT